MHFPLNGASNGTAHTQGDDLAHWTPLDVYRIRQEFWTDMKADERLPVIMDRFPIEDWFLLDALPTLAIFRHKPPGQWGQIRARFKAIGGDPFVLEREVDKLLVLATKADAETGARFAIISARELAAKVLPTQSWIIPDILPTGAALMTGRGKDGKSLMAWNLCVAIATGGVALSHYQVEQGDVLYLALEDGERRAQQRLLNQMQFAGMTEAPDKLDLVLWDAPKLGEGFEPALRAWIDEHHQARLVVVDILEKIRPKRGQHGSMYAEDYSAIEPLQKIAQERNLAILIVHHSNKLRAEDFRDTASGSTGLIAACDTFWALQRLAGAADAVLKITGRDVETQELALQFQDGFWSVLGDAGDYRKSQASQDVLKALAYAHPPGARKGWRWPKIQSQVMSRLICS